ncbi:MAG: T9SS type A sorting domain-containing protein, partial [Bacteroidales bacterium]|nr:T9SS type A sorting domain-containing protein [Bacteroidales bacterium]
VSGDSLFTAVFINDTVPVSVAVPDAQSCLTLRPNPASDRVEVVSCEAMAAIDLYDVTGRAAAHIEPRSETATLDVSALASGVYTVRATTQDGTVFTEKLLVKRQ